MKQFYVALTRRLRSLLRTLGLLGVLDAWGRRSRLGMWFRSLLSIYDLEDLLQFDVPWWTFKSADRVEAYLRTRPRARVFEWGSGASTHWLSRRAGEIISVEHDAQWAESMLHSLPPGIELKVVEPTASASGGVRSAKPGFEGLDFTDYVGAIDGVEGDFDLIVIDGRAREACLERSVDRLAPGGLIVFDNVDRARYVDAIAAEGTRLEVDWTRGLTPSLPYPTRTALLRVTGAA